MAEKKKILIVDDHPIIRKGLEMLINNEGDLEVCAQAADVRQALKAIRNKHADLVIVDITLAESSGMELIKDIKAQHPGLAVLALSMHDESLYAERALRAGAKGYIMKQEPPEKLLTAIRKVLDGQVYLSNKMASKIMNKLATGSGNIEASPMDNLSDRELEVFELIGQGQGTRQIAEKLHLSMKTIETYRAHIKEKLNLSNATELLQHAVRWVDSR